MENKKNEHQKESDRIRRERLELKGIRISEKWPPDFVRAVEIQDAYWSFNASEQSELAVRTMDRMTPREHLRLHHLNCLERMSPGPGLGEVEEKCSRSAGMLLDSASQYRPRLACIWFSPNPVKGPMREPDSEGTLVNLSFTHFGCFEIIRIGMDDYPFSLDFVGFDELIGVIFAPPKFLRLAKLLYEGGKQEIVVFPLVYGITWRKGDEMEREARKTRFTGHIRDENAAEFGVNGMGVGMQDFLIKNKNGKASMIGLASISELHFLLDIRDPNFDCKARGRGIDPDDVRRKMGIN